MLIPTQIEERVVDPDPVHPEHLGVDSGQDLLGRRRRGAVPTHVAVFRCRQSTAVEFAVDRQRQRLEHHHRRRHHIGRQPLGQLRAHINRIDRPGR